MDIRQFVLDNWWRRLGSSALALYAGSRTAAARGLVVAFAFESAASFAGPPFALFRHSSSAVSGIVRSRARVVVAVHHVPGSACIRGEVTCAKSDCGSIGTSTGGLPCGPQCVARDAPCDQTSGCRLSKHDALKPLPGSVKAMSL
jgi:hypothetical protein